MKIHLTTEQVDEIIKEINRAKSELENIHEDDHWGKVFAQDEINMLEEVLSRCYVVLSVEY